MFYFLVRLTVNALALFLTILLVPGIDLVVPVEWRPWAVVLALPILGGVFAVVNWILWPLLLLLLLGQLVL